MPPLKSTQHLAFSQEYEVLKPNLTKILYVGSTQVQS